uniref:ANK_REP_REGION domain-containing protein n=1 Tax=Gongylonema pulchrum TaxID=637853 RepID=A0A183EZ86_9BILA
LMEACALGHLGVARILLQHHARVDVFDENGRTALHLAAANGHLELTDLLLKNKAFRLLALGANPNARDDKGQTPLHLAAENDYPDVVKLFLKMRQNNRAVLTAIDLNGFTCAHIAAMKGSLAVVKELMMIDKAMVIQAKTKTMEATTLHMAAAGGHEKIVKILLENGADAEDENAVCYLSIFSGFPAKITFFVDC